MIIKCNTNTFYKEFVILYLELNLKKQKYFNYNNTNSIKFIKK